MGVEELESSTRRVRAGCVAPNTSLPKTGADAENRTQVGRVPGDCSATELRERAVQLSKSNKKARFSGRAGWESNDALDPTHPRRALDLSP